MLPYYLILFIELLLYIICQKKFKGHQQLCLMITFVLLFIFAAFRAETVGGDLQRYLPEFFEVSKAKFSDVILYGYGQRERGFAILERAIAFLSDTSFAFIFTTSLIFCVLGIRAIKVSSDNYILSGMLFTLLLYPNSYNIIRASLTVVIGLNMIPYIRRRELKKFLLLLLIAVLIQRTSIVLLPIYFLYGKRYSITLLLIMLFGSFALSYVLTGSFITTILNDYLNMALNDEFGLSYFSEHNTGVTKMAFFLLGMSIFMLYSYNKSKIDDTLGYFYITLLVIATCLQFFSSLFSLINRLSLFYYAFLIISLPYLFRIMPKSFTPIVRLGLIFIFIILYISGMQTDVQEIVPYKFI